MHTVEQIEHLRLFVDALRSGQYKQTRRVLKKGDCFCVLGVACDVAMKQGLPLKWDHDTLIDLRSLEISSRSMTRTVSDFYGLSPMGISKGISLTFLNDQGKSFDDIANLIEKELICPTA